MLSTPSSPNSNNSTNNNIHNSNGHHHADTANRSISSNNNNSSTGSSSSTSTSTTEENQSSSTILQLETNVQALKAFSSDVGVNGSGDDTSPSLSPLMRTVSNMSSLSRSVNKQHLNSSLSGISNSDDKEGLVLDRTASVPSSILTQLISSNDNSLTSTPQSPNDSTNSVRKRKKHFKTTEDFTNLEKTIYRESPNKFKISHRKRSIRKQSFHDSLSNTNNSNNDITITIEQPTSPSKSSSTFQQAFNSENQQQQQNSNSEKDLQQNFNENLQDFDDEEDDDEFNINSTTHLNEPIPTNFLDITDELNYYLKHNLIRLFKTCLETDRKERESTNKAFNVSSNYLDGNISSSNSSSVSSSSSTSGATLLHKAASLNRFKIISLLVDEYRALLEKKDSGGSTPLFYAVANNCIRSCVYLLMRGAKVNIKDNFENTPLSVALKKGYLDIAKTLCMFGADVNFKTQKGQTCLHLVCEEGDQTKVEFLLERGASLLRMNREDQHCLYSAAPHPHVMDYLCRYLLSIEEESVFNDSPPQVTNNGSGSSVIVGGKQMEIEEQNKHDRALFGELSAASSLASSTSSLGGVSSSGAVGDLNGGKPTLSKIVNRLSGAGNTIIHHCANFGYIHSLKLLINYIMSTSDSTTVVECLNEKDKKNGDSPLHLATRKGHQDIVLLLARAREVDVDAQNDAGDTALHLALQQLQSQEMTTILVAANCSISIKNNQKVTAKQLAKKLGISLKVEEDKTLKSLKSSNQGLNFFQKMKFKVFNKGGGGGAGGGGSNSNQMSLEEKAKRHTSAFPSYSSSSSSTSNYRASIKAINHYNNDGRRGSNNNQRGSSKLMTSQHEEIDEMIKQQPFIKWSSKMDFDSEMNEYHKELFYQVNKLYFIWVADHHSIQIQILLSDFIEKTRKFFSKQEQFMQENNMSGLMIGHKQDHDLFISKLESNLNKLNTMDFTMNEDLFAEISTMLINHLFKHDMPLALMKKKLNK